MEYIWLLGATALLCWYLYSKWCQSFWQRRKVFHLDLSKVVPWRKWLRMHVYEREAVMYEELKREKQAFGGIVEGRTPCLVVLDLNLLNRILVTDFEHFMNRRRPNLERSDPDLHRMLINKKGSEWKKLRSILSPTFTPVKLKEMMGVFDACGDRLVSWIEAKLETSDQISMRDIIRRYAMDVIAAAAFGIESNMFRDLNSPFGKWGSRFQNAGTGLRKLRLRLYAIAPDFCRALGLSMVDGEALKFFKDVIEGSMAERRRGGAERRDFLDLLMKAQQSTRGEMGDDDLLAQALLFFVAGFDATERLLLFATYELALHPEAQQKLAEELQSANPSPTQALSFEKLNGLPYLNAVISEALRKYPTGPRTERVCSKRYNVPNSNLVLEPGSVVVVPVQGIHHDPDYYKFPEKFMPERFLGVEAKERHPLTFMPFGVGPRNCIASRFALVESKSALARIIARFRLEPCQQTDIPLKYCRTSAFQQNQRIPEQVDGPVYIRVVSRDSTDKK